MDFDFSVVKKGFYRLKLTHFNSSRSISFNQLISISKDLNEHLQEAKNRFEIKTIDKGTIIYYRQALKLSDNDNTLSNIYPLQYGHLLPSERVVMSVSHSLPHSLHFHQALRLAKTVTCVGSRGAFLADHSAASSGF